MTRSVCLYVGDVIGQFEKGERIYFYDTTIGKLLDNSSRSSAIIYSNENFYNNFVTLDNFRLNKIKIIKGIINISFVK